MNPINLVIKCVYLAVNASKDILKIAMEIASKKNFVIKLHVSYAKNKINSFYIFFSFELVCNLEDHKVFHECSNCIPTCDEFYGIKNGTGDCGRPDCIPGCACNGGYLEDNDGNCVKPGECPPDGNKNL
jgi:hypothetical protein